MKGLSLTQPWATLVAIGAKKIETRSWDTLYRGEVAIHASKGFPTWAKEMCEEEPFFSALRPKYWRESFGGKVSIGVDRLPLGAIIATARIVTTNRTDFNLWPQIFTDINGNATVFELTGQEREFGDYSSGRYAWCLAYVVALPEPIPCKGALGLWKVPQEIESQIRNTQSPAPLSRTQTMPNSSAH